MLEQKVWLETSSNLYPNIYTILVGHPGVGKTRTIRAAAEYVHEIPDFHVAPTSMTAASLVDALLEAKRTIIDSKHGELLYNTMLIAADELGAFIHKYDNEMIAVLSAFYDTTPYNQQRRTRELKIKIKRPQLSLLCGSTPSNLIEFMPESAWGQGFTSRLMLIFSDERIIGDDFAPTIRSMSSDMLTDLRTMAGLIGKFSVTEEYRNAVNHWRKTGEQPTPTHPKLIHYNTRRKVHVYKLSMISAIDRSNVLLLTEEDFFRALGWLVEAETMMPEIFKAGAANADAQAMDEIYYFIKTGDVGQGVAEAAINRFAAERIPIHSILRVIEILEKSGRIRVFGVNPKTGQRRFSAV